MRYSLHPCHPAAPLRLSNYLSVGAPWDPVTVPAGWQLQTAGIVQVLFRDLDSEAHLLPWPLRKCCAGATALPPCPFLPPEGEGLSGHLSRLLLAACRARLGSGEQLRSRLRDRLRGRLRVRLRGRLRAGDRSLRVCKAR